jgi:hypothetical protein
VTLIDPIHETSCDLDLFPFIFDLVSKFEQAVEAVMKCPRCVQKIHRGAETCPHCGFSLALADQEFAIHDPMVKCLSDRAGLLRRVERDRVQRAIDQFCARFPQLFFCVHTAVFANPTQLRTFGFWLLNRGVFQEVSERANASGIVLVIDVERKAAGMTYGYHLDAYLDESDTFECLSKAHPHWLEGRHDDGIITLLKVLEKILLRTSRQAQRDPEKFAKKVMSSPRVGALLDRHREGSVAKESEALIDREEDS